MRRIFVFIPLFALSLSACTTNPTSGQRIFSVVSPQQEASLGAESHGQIMKQYNGVSDNEKMNEFVARIATRLVPHAERKDISWRFTVLNDDLVNAFAVPGGYIYITRGLINLAQDESQVAAVLAHEMGHVNARHSAQQMSQGMIANLGLSAIGIAIGSDIAGQVGGVGADLYLKSYSREHEYEADALSVRYLTAAGYDPYAAAKFLEQLELYTQLERRMAGTPSGDEMFSYFATHPPTPQRVARARALADQAPKNPNAIINRVGYLAAVDGTIYGDSTDQGLIRGNSFIHPKMGFRFDAPSGFTLKNTPSQVIAQNRNGAAMIFDMGNANTNDPASYLANDWAKGAPLTGQERITVNGLQGATAATTLVADNQQKDGRLVALLGDNGRFYRMAFLTPAGQMGTYAQDFRTATYSFRRLSATEADGYDANRVRVITVKAGDTVQSLAARMPVKDFAVERFCLLNGITPDTVLTPGERVKTVMAD